MLSFRTFHDTLHHRKICRLTSKMFKNKTSTKKIPIQGLLIRTRNRFIPVSHEIFQQFYLLCFVECANIEYCAQPLITFNIQYYTILSTYKQKHDKTLVIIKRVSQITTLISKVTNNGN